MPAFLQTPVSLLIALVYWIYSRFWFVHEIDFPTGGPYVCAHWHGDELLLVGRFRLRPMAVMASRSRDGSMMKTVLERFGYSVVRGSSHRGGAGGLKGLIDAVTKKGMNASLAVDGPRGPVFKVKPGIIELAKRTGRPILPGAASADRKFIFKKAWNQCYLPKPFSRCVIVYGKPFSVPEKATDGEMEEYRMKLEQQLLELKKRAENWVESKQSFGRRLELTR